MILLSLAPPCHWHSGFDDTAELGSAVSLTPRFQWYCWAWLRSVIDTLVSMILLSLTPQCWGYCTLEFLLRENHLETKCENTLAYSIWIRVRDGLESWKKGPQFSWHHWYWYLQYNCLHCITCTVLYLFVTEYDGDVNLISPAGNSLSTPIKP